MDELHADAQAYRSVLTHTAFEPQWDLTLTDLHDGDPGLRRLGHGYATSGTWRRLLSRALSVARETLIALPRDAFMLARGRASNLLRVETGDNPHEDATRAAIYVHYAPTGVVSAMVLCQLRQLRDAGFAVVFVSMARDLSPEDWDRVQAICALVVQRRNFGLDFGAWHDIAPEVRRRWPALEELMLANDSVLGPIRPMAPVIEALRSGGNGLFGLTESLQGGTHLQSYMLLARGTAAVTDLLQFITSTFVSHSKWLLIQMTEIKLAKWMQRRGHRVAALFGYERLIRASLADPAELKRVMASNRITTHLDEMPVEEAVALLHAWPLNPTHHLWHVLATQFGSPFLKTELVRRNPGRLPDVDHWAEVVPPDSPCALPVLQAHLAAMGRR